MMCYETMPDCVVESIITAVGWEEELRRRREDDPARKVGLGRVKVERQTQRILKRVNSWMFKDKPGTPGQRRFVTKNSIAFGGYFALQATGHHSLGRTRGCEGLSSRFRTGVVMSKTCTPTRMGTMLGCGWQQ